MIEKLATLIALFISGLVHSQVGEIIKRPHPSAQMDVVSEDKGIMIPHISLESVSDRTSISHGNVKSLLVYNNSSTETLQPGYYYWEGRKWTKIITDSDEDIFDKTSSMKFKIEDNFFILEDNNRNKISIALSAINLPDIVTTLTNDGNGIYTYTNENGVEVIIDILASLINNNNVDFNEYMTKLIGDRQTTTILENVTTIETDEFDQVIEVHTLSYTNEKGIVNKIDFSVLVKGVETVTNFSYDPVKYLLSYTNEKEEYTSFNLKEMIADIETITFLELDIDAKKLVYTDENKQAKILDLTPIIQEPWFSSVTNKGATSNTENLYTKGWVGIGYSKPSAAPNEKLRVNGTISTVSNYYADYVFEDYFDGFSKIKTEYKFNDLISIEKFIKNNRHLPGITPIHQLEQTAEGYSFNVSELSIQLLEKTEELYLHMIEHKKEINQKNLQIKNLEDTLKLLQYQVNQLELVVRNKK